MYEVIGHGHTRAFRVIWMLEELGVPYEHRVDGPHSDYVTAHSALGKVPVLLVDGQALTDSSAILSYLADRHGKLTHAAGTLERGRQDGIMHQALDELEGPLWTVARHSFILPEDERLADVKPALKREVERNALRLADRIEGPFVMGESMTIADIVATHCLNWARSIKFLPDDDRLAAYGKRMRDRPAFAKAAQLAAA